MQPSSLGENTELHCPLFHFVYALRREDASNLRRHRLTCAYCSAIHIFAFIKNASPNTRVHWSKDGSLAGASGREASLENFLP
jgi:hypothetical protein